MIIIKKPKQPIKADFQFYLLYSINSKSASLHIKHTFSMIYCTYREHLYTRTVTVQNINLKADDPICSTKQTIDASMYHRFARCIFKFKNRQIINLEWRQYMNFKSTSHTIQILYTVHYISCDDIQCLLILYKCTATENDVCLVHYLYTIYRLV